MATPGTRPELKEAELKCLETLHKLKKRYGTKRPPVNDVATAMGYSQSRTSQLMQLLELKGCIAQEFRLLV
ncbi:MAG TPA: hypothetical protein VHA06_06960 [Candidatus Angelobacter sp.]|nr:hypothetical protein [Candidatus Angelobacter sp.]